jgi:rRNA maturation endonuclease Nob1
MAERAEAASSAAAPIDETKIGSREIAKKAGRALPWALPLLSVMAAIAAGLFYDTGTAILVLAAGVLLGVIAILWMSVRTLSGDAPITLEEAVMLGAPSAAEEQKRTVLQALKDLEYERSVGKVSDADYEELLRRYRTEAKRLLRAVDEDLAPRRARAEAYIAEKLGPGARSALEVPHKKPTATRCTSCQTDNDVDALFCKKCGSKLARAEENRQDAAV